MQNVGFTSYLLKQSLAHAEMCFSQSRKVKQTTHFFVGDVANNVESMALDTFELFPLFL